MTVLNLVHEHIIEIARAEQNNGLLTRDDLWNQLKDFICSPQSFIESLEACAISADSSQTHISRTLDFGAFKLKDTVELIDGRQAITRVPATDMIPESEFTITIEEPEKGSLFMRFCYKEAYKQGLSDNDQVQGLRKKAWEDKDLRVVEMMMERLLKQKTNAQ
jgi:hypothetical protein